MGGTSHRSGFGPRFAFDPCDQLRSMADGIAGGSRNLPCNPVNNEAKGMRGTPVRKSLRRKKA
jgi:hypothetical protein